MLSHGEIAQLVEQSAHIRSVEGPSPPLAKVLASARIFFTLVPIHTYFMDQDEQHTTLILKEKKALMAN